LDLIGLSEAAFQTLLIRFSLRRDAERFTDAGLTGGEWVEQKEYCDKFVTIVMEFSQNKALARCP
jgi:hypothetical protein